MVTYKASKKFIFNIEHRIKIRDISYDTHLASFAKSKETTKASPERYIIKSKAVFLICTVLITSPYRTAQRRKMSVNGNVLVHVCTSSHAYARTHTHTCEVDAASWVRTVGRMHLASLNRKERYDRSVWLSIPFPAVSKRSIFQVTRGTCRYETLSLTLLRWIDNRIRSTSGRNELAG